MKDFMASVLVTIGLAGLTAPLVPLARTIGVNVMFWVLTRMKGKPNFTPGTEYLSLTAPSGARYGECWIERTDFGYIYVRMRTGGLLPIKKIRFKEYQAELRAPNPAPDPTRETD